jgi:PAS domain S-box-containing protein
MAILCAEVIDRKDTMPRSGKNNERIEQVPRGRKKSAKVEPLRPQAEHPDKLYNDLAKFPSENPYPVLRIHKDGTVLYANKASESLLKARGSGAGRPAPAQWHQVVKKALSSGQVIREETQHDGCIFALRAVPVVDSDYVNFYGVDITEQKKAEERVKAEHQRLYDVLETLPAMVCLLTPDYHVAFTNRVFREKFGEDNGRHCYDYIFGRKGPCEFCEAHNVLKTGKPHHWECTGPDGCSIIDVYDFPFTDTDGTPLILEMDIDITERKRAEEALRDSEVKFRTLFENMAAGTCIDEIVYEAGMPVDYRILDVNSSWEKITGVSRSQAVGSLATQLYALEKPPFFDIYVKVAETGEPVSFESYFPPIGKHLHITASCPARGRFSTVVTDITERKQTELSLKQSEMRFRELFNNMSSGVAIYEAVDDGQDFVFKDFNTAGQKMDKVHKKDVLGKRVTQVFPGVKEMGLLDVFQRVWLSGKAEHHPITIYKDGRITGWRENYVYKLPSGEIVAVYDDITEQMQARENLQKEQNLLRTLIDHIPDPVYLKDTNGKFIACNKALLKFWGIKNDCEVIGKTDYDFFDNSGTKEYFNEEQTVIQTKRPLINREGQCPDKAGRLHSFLVTKLPLRDSRGNVTGIVGINRDITEHRIAEKKLLEDQKQLKKLALQLALTEERERRRIARNLHDQVSQSLALAKIKLDTMLASEKSVPLTETLLETSNAIEKAIQDTRSLTFDLSYPILYELGFEAAVAEWLEEQVRGKYGIGTEFQDDGRPKPLDDDVRVLLFRNIRELLVNVIKHARADKVIVSVAKTDDSIKVKVEDNGVGLNVEEITASRKGGFGLFSIRESIGELGGSFEIESKPGAGCKVTITAPLKGIRRPKEE